MVRTLQSWFWVIPLESDRTSIGIVSRGGGLQEVETFRRGIFRARYRGATARCVIASAQGRRVSQVYTAADFSYRNAKAHRRSLVAGRRCRRFHRSGFQQRRFSRHHRRRKSGRCFDEALDHPKRDAAACSRVTSAWSIARWMFICVSLNSWYAGKEFIEVFLTPTGLLQIPPAVNAVLGGNIGNRFAIRWRMELFYLIVRLQKRWTLCPRLSLMPKADASNDSAARSPSLYNMGARSSLPIRCCSRLHSEQLSQFINSRQPSRELGLRAIGQLAYRGQKTSLIGEVLVRFSNRGDFELTFTKGPGVTLLVMQPIRTSLGCRARSRACPGRGRSNSRRRGPRVARACARKFCAIRKTELCG